MKKSQALTTRTVSVPEAARILGIGRGQMYQAVARGEIPSIRLGRTIKISTDILRRILESGSNKEVA